VQSVRLRARQSACSGGEDRAKSRQLADRCRGDMSVAGKQLMAESQAVVATIAKLLVEALDMWAILPPPSRPRSRRVQQHGTRRGPARRVEQRETLFDDGGAAVPRLIVGARGMHGGGEASGREAMRY
jgi:hypothetical protein